MAQTKKGQTNSRRMTLPAAPPLPRPRAPPANRAQSTSSTDTGATTVSRAPDSARISPTPRGSWALRARFELLTSMATASPPRAAQPLVTSRSCCQLLTWIENDFFSRLDPRTSSTRAGNGGKTRAMSKDSPFPSWSSSVLRTRLSTWAPPNQGGQRGYAFFCWACATTWLMSCSSRRPWSFWTR